MPDNTIYRVVIPRKLMERNAPAVKKWVENQRQLNEYNVPQEGGTVFLLFSRWILCGKLTDDDADAYDFDLIDVASCMSWELIEYEETFDEDACIYALKNTEPESGLRRLLVSSFLYFEEVEDKLGEMWSARGLARDFWDEVVRKALKRGALRPPKGKAKELWQSLNARVQPFDEFHAAIICRELLLALDYLHSSGKIHRDIKAANILLSSDGKVKVADFGVAAQLTNIKSQRMTFVGTPYWMAPEVIQENGHDFKADIWSLGITAMELVQGEPPNAELHPMKALFHIPKASPPRLDMNKFSREFRAFVGACLMKDPDKRPTARDLLQHRFINRAGRVSALKNLITSRHNREAIQPDRTEPKYYEETLRNMAPSKEEDDWVFGTVKPAPVAARSPPHTAKKRKLSEPPTVPASIEPPSEQLSRMDINEDENMTVPSSPTPAPRTVKTVQRRHSAVGTARRISTPSSKPTPTMRKISSPIYEQTTSSPSRDRRRSSIVQKQPLAIDTSFGNGTSNMRQFRRVSDEAPIPVLDQSAVERPTDENVPPPVEAVTKEAKTGRRIFSKVWDPAFQEVYAQTAAGAAGKQEALSRVGQAWSALDAMDPEGEYVFFRAVVDRLQSDPKLSFLLRPPITPSRAPSTPQQLQAQLSNSTSLHQPQTPSRTPSKSPSKQSHTPSSRATQPQQQSHHKPSASTGNITPQRSPSKLVMAQANPHLKRQSLGQAQGPVVSPGPQLERRASERQPDGKSPQTKATEKSREQRERRRSKRQESGSSGGVGAGGVAAGALPAGGSPLKKEVRMPPPPVSTTTDVPMTGNGEAEVMRAKADEWLNKRDEDRRASFASSTAAMAGDYGGYVYALPAQQGAVQAQAYTKGLADVLYGRWVEGVRGRWPQV
ncbi:MAG: hypothetical protein M1831_001244 [Alyxoria varia]|nr:MAG: hypothetical protein M1831_001244 [Alyxoria varia]